MAAGPAGDKYIANASFRLLDALPQEDAMTASEALHTCTSTELHDDLELARWTLVYRKSWDGAVAGPELRESGPATPNLPSSSHARAKSNTP